MNIYRNMNKSLNTILQSDRHPDTLARAVVDRIKMVPDLGQLREIILPTERAFPEVSFPFPRYKQGIRG